MTLRHLCSDRWLFASVLCAAAGLGGCASGPPAEPALAAGAASIDAARSSGAPELAAAQLNEARTKLERARALAQVGRNREAIRLAEEAEADAQLARAVAASERSRRAVNEVEASLATLRDELSRNSSPGAAIAVPVPPGGSVAPATLPQTPPTPSAPPPGTPATRP